jgi:gamma-glutamylcyclotransferase (GGCT)/AIG2-like uncharacterized protein YtfP
MLWLLCTPRAGFETCTATCVDPLRVSRNDGRVNANHHQLDGLDGRWLKGHVNGILVDAGWGANLGYPALVLQADGPAIDVEVFESADLPDHWARLDDFEGDGYQRVVTTARTPTGELDASIYVHALAQN